MEKEIRKKLLEKMLRGEYIGTRYMSYDDAHKGFPRDLAGRVRKVVHELIKDGLIVIPEKKPFTAISLNPKRISEIAEIIRDP